MGQFSPSPHAATGQQIVGFLLFAVALDEHAGEADVSDRAVPAPVGAARNSHEHVRPEVGQFGPNAIGDGIGVDESSAAPSLARAGHDVRLRLGRGGQRVELGDGIGQLRGLAAEDDHTVMVGDPHGRVVSFGKASQGLGGRGGDISIGKRQRQTFGQTAGRLVQRRGGPGLLGQRLTEGGLQHGREDLIPDALAHMTQTGAPAVVPIAVGGEDTDRGRHQRQDVAGRQPVGQQHPHPRLGAERSGHHYAKPPLPVAPAGDKAHVVDPRLAAVVAAGQGDLELAGQVEDAVSRLEMLADRPRQGDQVGSARLHAGAWANRDVSQRVAASAQARQAHLGDSVLDARDAVIGQRVQLDILPSRQVQGAVGRELPYDIGQPAPLLARQMPAQHFEPLHPLSFLTLRVQPHQSGYMGILGDLPAGETEVVAGHGLLSVASRCRGRRCSCGRRQIA